jgi:hypothetical protein
MHFTCDLVRLFQCLIHVAEVVDFNNFPGFHWLFDSSNCERLVPIVKPHIKFIYPFLAVIGKCQVKFGIGEINDLDDITLQVVPSEDNAVIEE